jgi:hypothetical protein
LHSAIRPLFPLAEGRPLPYFLAGVIDHGAEASGARYHGGSTCLATMSVRRYAGTPVRWCAGTAFPAVVGPAPQVAPQVTPQVVAILTAARRPRSRSELQESARLKDREHFRVAYLEPLLAARWLEMTIPDKPTSSKQQYRVTEAGRQALTRHTDGDD